MIKVAVDLTWLKPGKSGGIEFYSRNLLRGIQEIKPEGLCFIIFLSRDNTVIKELYSSELYTFVVCRISAHDVWRRILWQNVFFNSILRKHKIDVCLTPFYSVPLCKASNTRKIAVIHDIQALHYPQYFSIIKRIWLKFAWKRTLDNCDCIVTISNFCRNDILSYYGQRYENKIRVIYNPIDVTKKVITSNRKSKELFFYTICSEYEHKNFKTLIKIIAHIKKERLPYPNILYVSGIKAFSSEIMKLISELGLNDNIKLTGYISDEQRNEYYLNCKAFLFPSLFEGFGMPVVEAMMLNVPVITTNLTSIPEVSKGLAIYVENPFDILEWVNKIGRICDDKYTTPEFDGNDYNYKTISSQFISLINQLF